MATDSRRQSMLTRSIQYALFHDPETFKKTPIGRILAIFCIFYIKLIKYQSDLFRKLRNDIWMINDREYEASFRTTADQRRPLQLVGDLGYSGSVRLHSQMYIPAVSANNATDILHHPRHQVHHQISPTTLRALVLPPGPPRALLQVHEFAP